jgi:hypothetical protein
MNLRDYTELEGLANRLMPAKAPGSQGGWVATDIMYNNMMHNFYWRGLDIPGKYYDENYLRFPINARSQYHRLAGQLLVEGKKDKAREVLLHALKVMPDKSVPYDMAIPPYVPLLFKVGEDKVAMEIAETMGTRAISNLKYLRTRKSYTTREPEINLYVLDQLSRALKQAGKDKLAAEYAAALDQNMDLLQ